MNRSLDFLGRVLVFGNDCSAILELLRLGLENTVVQLVQHLVQHPLEHGQTFYSPGCHFTYRVIGPCCRLFDREELPWPCCRLQWRGKEPSWRRIGRRFVPDLATRNSPSYAVEVVGQEYAGRIFVVTLYAVKLPQPIRDWWFAKKPQPSSETILTRTF